MASSDAAPALGVGGDSSRKSKPRPFLPPALVETLKDEYQHPGKRAANLKLLRALAVFAAGVIVARNFGEALFVA
jgi:hypothetical protein